MDGGQARDAVTLYSKVLGEQNTESLVFLPGFTGSHDVWNADFQALSQRYRLILLDTLGFGYSPKPDIAYTLDDHLTALHATLRSLRLETTHFVGHSMGCLLALAYANSFPSEVSKIVLLALPCYSDVQEARRIIANSSRFNRWIAIDTPLAQAACAVMCHLRPLFMAIAPALAPDVPAVVARDALRHTWASYSKTLNHVIFQAQTETWLCGTRNPLLIIQGTRDTVAPLEHVRRMIVNLPNVGLVPVDADHRLIFTHSREIARRVIDFLQEPSSPAA